MSDTILLCDNAALYDLQGRPFDPLSLSWGSLPSNTKERTVMRELGIEEALIWLQMESGTPIRPPVAVIGPREATNEQRTVAHAIGRDLASLGFSVLCGGRQGVMEAVCRGVAEKGGISVGLIPDAEWSAANPYVTVPIATGIGIARNTLISQAALVVIAVGGGLGTLSEIALSLQFGKTVFTLCDAPVVDGAREFSDWSTLKPALYRTILGLEK